MTIFFRTRVGELGSGDAAALPDGGVEGVDAIVPLGLVELDGLGVGLGHGEGDLAHALAHEMGAATESSMRGESVAAEVGMYAELSDVAALRADA